MITDNAIAAAIPARAVRSARRSSDCDKPSAQPIDLGAGDDTYLFP